MVAKKTTAADAAPFDFAVGAVVRVDIAGRVVGRSEFEEGPPAYLVEYERRGKLQKEWIVGDKLVSA